MLTYALLVSALLSSGNVVYSPAFYYNTKAECDARAAKVTQTYTPSRQVPNHVTIVSVNARCHEVVPAKDLDECSN